MEIGKKSFAPHIIRDDTVSGYMKTVALSLVPVLIWGYYIFGVRVISHLVLSVVSTVLFERIIRKMMKKPSSTGDFSAVVTGIFLTLTLPVSAPLWFAPIGAFFAIVLTKELFGGLGKNFLNPTLCARALLYLSFPTEMTRLTKPFSDFSPFDITLGEDVIAQSLEKKAVPLSEIAFGKYAGAIGETGAAMLILGGLFLVVAKIIAPHIPAAFVGTVAVLTYVFSGGSLSETLRAVFSGGVLLVAIFMATDPVTSPVTYKGKLIFGAGCGALTVFFRKFGAAGMAPTFAVLTMEVFVWYIDKFTRPRVFGGKRVTK